MITSNVPPQRDETRWTREQWDSTYSLWFSIWPLANNFVHVQYQKRMSKIKKWYGVKKKVWRQQTVCFITKFCGTTKNQVTLWLLNTAIENPPIYGGLNGNIIYTCSHQSPMNMPFDHYKKKKKRINIILKSHEYAIRSL